MKLYHGGKAGLRDGWLLAPSPPHVEDGCPVCVARAEGRTYTVGEFVEWMKTRGPRGLWIAQQFVGIPKDAPLDPPSSTNAVYVTSDIRYARWYAARSAGDLYQVEPIGDMTPSAEDHFPTWTVPSARIVRVLKRKVRLSPMERRELLHAWKLADIAAGAA